MGSVCVLSNFWDDTCGVITFGMDNVQCTDREE